MKTFSATITVLLSFAASPAGAQTFSSGSTGADGALDLSTMACTECEVQLPPNGVLNYTTVTVPDGKQLFFRKNLQNTPVYLLAQGSVTIAGYVVVKGVGQQPGPGGFLGGPPNLNGGQGPNLPGFGPGAGPQQDGNRNGKWVGPLSLVPTIGGSGAQGGSQCTYVGESPYGGGGGGAITIASSAGINISGTGKIFADGAGPQCSFGGAGGGSGGAIRLVANSISVSGTLTANGAPNGDGRPAFNGVIRLEAPMDALSFTGTAQPPAVLSTINATILPATVPSLSIVSVGGYPVPTYSGQRFDTVDLLLPMQLPDPINVVVAANNIPVGTQIQISFGTTNTGTVVPGTLTGSTQSSSATIQVSGLNRTQLAYLFVRDVRRASDRVRFESARPRPCCAGPCHHSARRCVEALVLARRRLEHRPGSITS